MQLITVKIDKPEASNFILGQTHFIKSVEDLHEALVATLLPAERVEHRQNGAGGMPHFLRNSQSHRGDSCRDGTGARHPGRGGRLPCQRNRGRRRNQLAQKFVTANRLQALIEGQARLDGVNQSLPDHRLGRPHGNNGNGVDLPARLHPAARATNVVKEK